MLFDKSLDNDDRLLSVMKRLVLETGRRHIKGYALAFALSAIVAGTTGAVAFLLEDVINEVFVHKNVAALLGVSLAVMAIFVIRGFAMFGQAVVLTQISNAVQLEIQTRLFKKVMSKEPSYVLSRTTGELTTVIGNGAGSASALLTGIANAVGRDIFTLIALVTVLFLQDPGLATAMLIGVPIIAMVVSAVSRRLRALSRQQLATVATLDNRIRSAIQGIRVVKSFSMERATSDAMERNADDFRRLADKHAVISNRVAPFMELFGGVAIAGAIAFGGWQVIERGDTPGELVSFLFAALMAYDPARRLGIARVGLERALVGVRFMYRFLDEPNAQIDRPDARPLALSKAEIRFNQVGFSYVDEEPVFRDLSFTAPAGRTTAIVGRSGAGKTTIANLLLRFWPVSGGAILVDEQNVNDVTVNSLREAIAYVGQDAFVFDGTIRDNLLVGDPEAGPERLREAAAAAGALDFIEEMPGGFEAQVGELGANLSGGQRQRLSIARALLRDAPIVLLDEPTSALDADTERAIQASLKRLSVGRTTIIIAHRLSTIRDADQIVVLDHGHVAEVGTHDALIDKQGLYASFYSEAGAAAPGENADGTQDATEDASPDVAAKTSVPA